ncbi:MAG TPA: hypothetical protein VFN35_12550 [Ktedonobacteraceae bacterium]|nr:hypothetical protein [Ktedonobacteraceae bacterium]
MKNLSLVLLYLLGLICGILPLLLWLDLRVRARQALMQEFLVHSPSGMSALLFMSSSLLPLGLYGLEVGMMVFLLKESRRGAYRPLLIAGCGLLTTLLLLFLAVSFVGSTLGNFLDLLIERAIPLLA